MSRDLSVTFKRPHAMQMYMDEHAEFENWVCAGRRLGKTEKIPEQLIKPALKGHPVAFYGPTSGNSDTLWRAVSNKCREANIGNPNETRRDVEMIGGGRIKFWTLNDINDIEKSRGQKHHTVVMDEVSIIKYLEEALDYVILPTLGDYIKDSDSKEDIKGRLWGYGTARGQDFFYNRLKAAGSIPGIPSSEKDIKGFVIPTAIEDADGNIIGSNNPHMSIRALTLLKSRMPLNAWKQEFLCEFLDKDGVLFKRAYFERPGGIVNRSQVPIGLNWKRYYDLAASTKASADYTACIAVAHDPYTGVYYLRDLIHDKYEVPDSYQMIKNTMLSERATYNTEHGIEKQYVGLGVTQYLDRDPDLAGIGYRAIDAKGDKYTRASIWALYAEQKRIVLVEGAWIPKFLDEVCSFTGNPKFDKHDDIVDSVSGGVIMIGGEKTLEFY